MVATTTRARTTPGTTFNVALARDLGPGRARVIHSWCAGVERNDAVVSGAAVPRNSEVDS